MKTIALALLMVNCAFAGTLDTVIAKINKDINPRWHGDIGYEVDYRKDAGSGQIHTWINIVRVKKDCGTEDYYVIKNSKVTKHKTKKCSYKPYSIATENYLFQIQCKTSIGTRCINNLIKEVNTDSIKHIIINDIRDAYVE